MYSVYAATGGLNHGLLRLGHAWQLRACRAHLTTPEFLGAVPTLQLSLSGVVQGVAFELLYVPQHHVPQGQGSSQLTPARLEAIARLPVVLDFHIPATTPEQARRELMIWTPLVWREYHRLSEQVDPTVEPYGVRFRGFGFEPLDVDVPAVAQHMISMVHEIERVRPTIPCASDLEPHRPFWARFAQQHGLAFAATPLSVHGRVGGMQVWCWVQRGQHNEPMVMLRAALATPLSIGLSVAPMTKSDKFLFFVVGQDIKTGDTAFDKAFRVRGHDEEAVRRGLDARVRAQIQALAQRYQLGISDSGVQITVSQGPEALSQIEAIVAEVRGLVVSLEGMRHGG